MEAKERRDIGRRKGEGKLLFWRSSHEAKKKSTNLTIWFREPMH
jgi:hypothetical protein